jgi:hypothetical protein
MYKISKDACGENIEIVGLTGSEAFLRHEQRDTVEPWFYWAFHADGLPNRAVTFRFTYEVVGPFGPAVSTDGVDWQWLGEDSSPDRRTFTYTNAAGHNTVYFSFCLGYRPQNLGLFIKKHEKNPLFRASVLTRSESGADIPLFEAGRRDAKLHILLTARHHACEAPGNYVMEGFLEHALSEKGFIAENCLIHAVPFMDYDGVVAGDAGKDRFPHDHNRDYIDNPLYASVRAVKALTDKYDGKISAALDFHAPLKWGGNDDTVFGFKYENTENAMDAYWALIREQYAGHERGQVLIGDIAYPHYMGAGIINSCSGYMRLVKNVLLSAAFETPYFGTPDTFTVTPFNMRVLGRRYALALEAFGSSPSNHRPSPEA